MPTPTIKKLTAGAPGNPGLLTDSLLTFYTVPGSTTTEGIVIALMNDHTADVLVDLHLVPSGGSASATNKRYKGSSPNGLYLKPGETIDVVLPDVLTSGDFIQMKGNVTNVVSARLSGVEVA